MLIWSPSTFAKTVGFSDDSFMQVIGVPATIDGDLKNQFVETDVGFDTTCKVTLETGHLELLDSLDSVFVKYGIYDIR